MHDIPLPGPLSPDPALYLVPPQYVSQSPDVEAAGSEIGRRIKKNSYNKVSRSSKGLGTDNGTGFLHSFP